MQSVNAMATNKNSRSDMTPKKNLAQWHFRTARFQNNLLCKIFVLNLYGKIFASAVRQPVSTASLKRQIKFGNLGNQAVNYSFLLYSYFVL
jgi:hypothetical protein